MELPEIFKLKMTKLLGDESSKFFAALEEPQQKGITVNYPRLKGNTFEDLCDFDIKKIPMIDNGYYVNNFKFSHNILSHLGIIYSQEPSAMYPVEMLDIKPGDIVLDVCAAPGGKSVQILDKLNNSGFLLSNEIVYSRSKILYENLNRMGFKNFAISCNSPEELGHTQMLFDKILVDAPCGGEGMFRRDNFDSHAYNPDAIDSNAKRQLSILENIKNLLRCGGRLVYSTCTYDIRENEEVVAKFLSLNPDYKLIHKDGYESVTSKGITTNHPTEKCYRRYPHLHRGEGQFMAILEKIGNEEIESQPLQIDGYKILYKKEKDNISVNFKNIFNTNNQDIVKKGDNYYILHPDTIPLTNLNILLVGCLIGTYINKTFKLHHNIYHTYGDCFFNKINVSLQDAMKYIHGEELDVNNTNGVYAICYKDIPLGGGKIVNGKLKNYYPKELRI